MLRRCEGFSLLEVLVAFNIFVGGIAMYYPIILTVQERKLENELTERSIHLLTSAFYEYVETGKVAHTTFENVSGISARLTTNYKGDLLEICVEVDQNQFLIVEDRCIYAKK
ncbi:type II secretion system protein [Bacillus solimangrovi]|uniref:Uncharacterized protein n=1 Tax=Bacillus solimangrovi TaxID=1305675 RepID=A0A1E5LFP3_9BACI|nr:hypothetical protein [Bacillus solimangrovi]OEH92883.1 hypothetical protein BFG57_14495 [Bacillus solimangrovi]